MTPLTSSREARTPATDSSAYRKQVPTASPSNTVVPAMSKITNSNFIASPIRSPLPCTQGGGLGRGAFISRRTNGCERRIDDLHRLIHLLFGDHQRRRQGQDVS